MLLSEGFLERYLGTLPDSLRVHTPRGRGCTCPLGFLSLGVLHVKLSTGFESCIYALLLTHVIFGALSNPCQHLLSKMRYATEISCCSATLTITGEASECGWLMRESLGADKPRLQQDIIKLSQFFGTAEREKGAMSSVCIDQVVYGYCSYFCRSPPVSTLLLCPCLESQRIVLYYIYPAVATSCSTLNRTRSL